MRRLGDRLFTLFAGAGAAVALLVIATVVGLVVFRGAGAISWRFFFEQSRAVGAEGGVLYHLAGTFILIATAGMIALPVAAGVGLYHQLYLRSDRGRRSLEALLHALNGIPSIVFGLFGLAFFVQLLGMRKSWLAGGILLAMMILPTVTVAFLEKLRAIPPASVEAAFGLGLRRNHIAWSLLLPQGAAGLVTGTLLGLARAAGETAPIMFTAVIFAGATVPRGIVDSPVLALPYHIFVLAQDSFDPAMTTNMWGSAIVLLMLVITLSLIALPLRLRIHEEARRV
ncbi:MAG TPA: phosphate ABC transporter permease PstA [Thermoanaerobaculia bacterium]|nr:phosphate ABC transporter permease PstA [Thermoanaerobaculia bacterium]